MVVATMGKISTGATSRKFKISATTNPRLTTEPCPPLTRAATDQAFTTNPFHHQPKATTDPCHHQGGRGMLSQDCREILTTFLCHHQPEATTDPAPPPRRQGHVAAG
ncbi:MAG: hypothetical protein LUD39_06675, partial [Opitutae bacterium]|nr:hypothetical protein [Opitutae bacterium]MCD8299414.1 hypothetical protein [Opitutae bacterium]